MHTQSLEGHQRQAPIDRQIVKKTGVAIISGFDLSFSISVAEKKLLCKADNLLKISA
jgi:hypothetical protein